MADEQDAQEPQVDEQNQSQEDQVSESEQVGDEQNGPQGDEASFDASKALDKIKKLNSEAKNLRAAKKAAEDKAAAAGDAADRAKSLEAENLRLRVAASNGLPVELIDRLKGDTEEEILKDAETLLELIAAPKGAPSNRPKPSLRGGGEPQVEPEEVDPRKLAGLIPRR